MRSVAARTSASEATRAVGRDEALLLQQLAGGDQFRIDPGRGPRRSGVVHYDSPMQLRRFSINRKRIATDHLVQRFLAAPLASC